MMMTLEQLRERIRILETIAADAEADVLAFEGKPFTGRTMAEYFGLVEAAIQALAKLVTELYREREAELELLLDQAPPAAEIPSDHVERP